MTRVKIKRGDIVEVTLQGAVGAEKTGPRPAVVIQNDGGNERSPLTIVALITGAEGKTLYPQRVAVGAAEMGPNGKDSVIECGHILTIDRDQRITAKGVTATLPPATMRKVDRAIRASLGL